MNEHSLLGRFMYAQTQANTTYTAIAGTQFLPEVIPVDGDGKYIKISSPLGMYVSHSSRESRINFNMREKNIDSFQIKAVMEGTAFGPLEALANVIDDIFDWANQIDVNTNRPKCQQIYVDTVDNTKQLVIMSIARLSKLKYEVFIDGVNYCNLGGIYEIEYYTQTTT